MSEFCSLCQVDEVDPYCLEHGEVHQPFSIGERYDVEKLIGAPASPFLFSAHDRVVGSAVAVRVLGAPKTGAPVAGANEAQQRFLREAAALSELAHEHIVGILDFGWDDTLGVAYVVTERLSGQLADAMVRQTGPLPWKQVIPLLTQVCRALSAAHQRGIVDGSLAAKKVFVMSEAGRQVVKLCDFGFTKIARASSPKPPDPRNDIYGIATIAHELLTGRPPLEGGRASGAITDEPISMNEWMPELALPGKLDELIRTCQARNPALRPNLAEVQATLLSIGAASDVWRAVETQVTATFTAEPDPLAVPEMIGSYRVVSELGEGGTGRVYLGQHPVIGSKVAIKVLLPEIAQSTETVNRFIQEARASSQIGSPHIPRYFDFGTTPTGLPYAIMEYFDGETLGERITRTGTISIAETAQILTQVASALLMAHETGLIHRDLKPDNIFLVKPDSKAARTGKRATAHGTGPVSMVEVKVLDFGIAKVVGNTPAAHTTQTGSFLGTPFYCAPEQVFGHAVDARTDVYSLGATAFEMLSGAPPFTGLVPEILSSKATQDPPDLRNTGIPDNVAHTIRKMLAREPEYRAPSMAWVLEEVASWSLPDDQSAASSTQIEIPNPRTSPDQRPLPADHRQTPTEQPGLGDRKAFARANTALPSGDDEHEPATASQAMHALTLPHSRARRWPALAIIGGVLTVAAVFLGVAWSRSDTPASQPDNVQQQPLGSATARATTPPTTTPPTTAPPTTTPPTTAPPTTAPPTTAPPTTAEEHPTPVAGATTEPGGTPPNSPLPGPPPGQSPGDGSASKPVDEHAAHTVPHRPGTKPPKKPPPKKPPGDQKDMLIVDPFAHGN